METSAVALCTKPNSCSASNRQPHTIVDAVIIVCTVHYAQTEPTKEVETDKNAKKIIQTKIEQNNGNNYDIIKTKQQQQQKSRKILKYELRKRNRMPCVIVYIHFSVNILIGIDAVVSRVDVFVFGNNFVLFSSFRLAVAHLPSHASCDF